MMHFTYHCTWDKTVVLAECAKECWGPSWRERVTIIPHDNDDWEPSPVRLYNDPLYWASVNLVLLLIREMCKLVM